jgi:hypothetical protein
MRAFEGFAAESGHRPEQTYKWPADMDLAPGYDLMLRVTRTNTIPPDPYTS